MSVVSASIVWAALVANAPVTPEAAYREAARVLGQEQRYRFCAKDSGYEPSPIDLRWCELAAAAEFRGCPGYEQVCASVLESGSGGVLGEGAAGTGPGEDFNPRAHEEPEPVEEPEPIPELGGVARALVWLMIGLFLLFAFYTVRRHALSREEAKLPEPEPEPDSSQAHSRAAQVARMIETDVERLLARADEAERRGDFEQAIAEVYAALVRRLEGEGLIHVDRWKTNGDYLRELGQREDEGRLRDEVRAIIRSVEQVQFGAATAEATRYRDLRARIVALVRRASLALLLGLGLGGQLACDPLAPQPNSDASREDARSTATRRLAGLGTSPARYRGAAELLLAFDIDVRHRLRTIEELSASEGAILVLDVELTQTDWQRLLDWVHDEGGLLVIATRRELPEAAKLGYAQQDRHARTQLIPGPYAFEAAFSELTTAAPAGHTLVSTGSVSSQDALLSRPAIEAEDSPAREQPYAMRQYHGAGELVIFSEADMWRNAGLLVEDNAALLVNLFTAANIDSLEIVDGRTGKGPESPLESVREAKLAPLFVQLLVLLALLYAAAGLPFTRLRDPIERQRRAFSEHVRTLGERYAQVHAAHHVATRYSAWALDHLRTRLLPGGAGGLHALAQALAARTGRDEGKLMALLVEAHELREQSEPALSPGELLSLMRELSKLVSASARLS